MLTVWQDFRYAFRKLSRSPGFAIVAVLTLALGVGANTAIYSVVNAVLIRPLSYENPDQLVVVWERNFPRSQDENVVATVNYFDWREQNQVFEDMTAIFPIGVTITGGDRPERAQVAAVTPEYFRLLRAEASVGRVFLPEEGEPGKDEVVVLSHGLWRSRFAGRPDVIGKRITLNGTARTVIGIMPPGFEAPRIGFLREPDLWAPLALGPSARRYNGRSLHVLARLAPGVTLERAREEMTAIARRLEAEHDYNAGWGANVVPLHEQIVGNVRTALLVLLGAVGFVLLISCANVANLLLARASGRQREIAIRTALGAARRRLIVQLLTESTLLASMGGAAGLVLAVWGVDLLIAIGAGDVPRANEVGISGSVLTFTLAISLLAGLLFGLVPALQSSRPDLHEALKEGGRGFSPGAGRRARNALVVSEIAIALVLLIGAGLAMRSFWQLRAVDPGFEAENVLSARIALPRSSYPEDRQRVEFFRDLISRVESLPEVRSAGATLARPLGGGPGIGTSLRLEGRPEPPRAERPVADVRIVTPGYFRTMAVPLLRGREFEARDDAEAPSVVVINESMARTYWPDGDPLGERVTVNLGSDPSPSEIVGVVGDVRHGGLDTTPRAKVYFAHAQFTVGAMDLVLRTTSDPARQASSLRREVLALDGDIPVYSVNTMKELVYDSVARERFQMLLMGVFSAVAMLLASVGIYGVMSYVVSQRTQEIGLRMALGAERATLLRLVVGQGMVLAVIGVTIGLAASLAVTRVMSGLLFGVSPTDPLTFAAVAVLAVGVCLAACYVPAWRATRVDPNIALRYE